MNKFYPLKIKDIRRETDDCVSIAFDIPTNLATIFAYKSGQYLTFGLKLTKKKSEGRIPFAVRRLTMNGALRLKKLKMAFFQPSPISN